MTESRTLASAMKSKGAVLIVNSRCTTWGMGLPYVAAMRSAMHLTNWSLHANHTAASSSLCWGAAADISYTEWSIAA